MEKVENAPAKLAEKLAAGTNSVFGLFTRRQFEINAAKSLSQADFYTRYYALFWFGLALAGLAQVASLVSEYGYFESVLSVKLAGYALTCAAGLAVVVLEFAKYFIMNRVFADLFRLAGVRVPYGLAVVAIAISALSIYASIRGGGGLAVNPQAIESAASPHLQEITTLRQEIADIKQRNTWKGKTWIAGAEKALLHQKEQLLTAAIAAKEKATAEAEAKESEAVATYQYAFSAFELVFIVCTLWAWYFRKRVAVEAEINNLPAVHGERNTVNVASDLQPLPQVEPKPANRIGFTFGWQGTQACAPPDTVNVNNGERSKQKACEHCGQTFTKKHWNARYCCDDCRISAWELRTGKTFNKLKK